MRRTIKKVVVSLMVLVFYFTILAPFLPSIQSFVNSFIIANANLFRYNTTSYEYEVVNGSIVQKAKVVTIDYTTFMSFLVSLLIAFVPILLVIGIIFGRW